MKPAYSISVVCHNNLELTKKCIASVQQHSKNYELIITDNGSTDGTAEYLKTLAADNVGIITNEKNEGFIAPHNRALEFAKGAYFVVLNNDIEVSAGWLEKMQDKFVNNRKLALVGLKGMCCSLDEKMGGFIGDKLEYVEASLLMTPTYLVKKHGLFSTYLTFAYGEDSDLSLRMRELGYQIDVVDLPIKHVRAATANIVKNKVPLHLYHVGNHAILRERWKNYFPHRNFNKEILIIRKHAHGDVLMVTPIIEALKKKWADAEITVQTAHPEIFNGNPLVKQSVTEIDHTQFNYVYNLDMAYEKRPNMHIVDAYAEEVGVEVKDWKLRLYATPEAREFAKKKMFDGKWAIIHAGATAWNGRNWEKEKFEEVARFIRQKNWNVAVVGSSPNHVINAANLNLIDKTSIENLIGVIECCDLFVGIDSFPMHIAQAFMRPTVAVFGTINPTYRLIDAPFIKGVHADPQQVPCVFEHHRLPAPAIDSHCSGACMKAVSVGQVTQAIDDVLQSYEMQLETSKIRDKVLPYCEGRGIDIGCLRDKIKPDAVGVDKDSYPEVDVVCDASKDMPFKDGEFDYVYSSHCLEDMVDTKGTMVEWLRILKPGGNFILQVPHADLYHGYNADHKHDGFREDDLLPLFEELGCEVKECWQDKGDDRYSLIIVAKKGTSV